MLTLALSAHLLLAAAPAQLTIDVKPDGVEVKVDGKKSGVSGAKAIVVKLKAGRHVVRLSHKGDSHEEEVDVKAGEKKTWSWAFEGAKPTAMPTDEQATPSE
ncbi:MAG: PEGA domain-containing protein [Myxococcaceae bacterium]